VNKKVLNIVAMKTASIKLSFILLALAILSSCTYSRSNWEPPIKIVEQPRVQLEVDPGMEITLRAIPGKLLIKGIDGKEAVATIEARCPGLTGRCADHFEDLDFDIKRTGNNLTISANKGIHFRGNSSVETILALPPVDRLEVKMIAGDLDISQVNVNELDVDMTAGDLDIKVDQLETLYVDLEAGDVDIVIPENSVAEIDLDAGVGNASIRKHGSTEDAPRSFLVGAQMHMLIARKGAIVNVDVQFGNIEVNLTP